MATRKTKKRAVKATKVMVGRFGQEPQTVTVRGAATVKAVLVQAGIGLNTRERVWVNGGRATPNTKVKGGDIVSVVTPKEAGL